jgi:hypothetical protein
MKDVSSDSRNAVEATQSVKSIAKDMEQPAIKAVQGMPEETSDETEAMNRAMERANFRVAKHVPTPDGKEVEYYKLRGRIGEELAVENLPGSVNINDVTGKSNFANFDIVSPYEMSSVKVKSRDASGEIRTADYYKYFSDITNPMSKANQRAASDLIKLRDEEPGKWQKLTDHLPKDVVNAQNQFEMANAFTKVSSLRISGDQVAEAREKMIPRTMKHLEEYRQDASNDLQTREQLIQRLVRDRIKPIDKRQTFKKMDIAARTLQEKRVLVTD